MAKRKIKRMYAGGATAAGNGAVRDAVDRSYGGGKTAASGSAHQAAITQASAPAAPMSLAGNATVADKEIANKYEAAPQENVPTDRDYWNAVDHLGKRYADYKNYGNSTLDNIGNWLAGSIGVGEMDPTRQAMGASIDDDNASWGFDPIGALTGVAGMLTHLPIGTAYQAAKKLTGYPGPQIAFDGKQYLNYGMPSSPIAQGQGVYSSGPQSPAAPAGPERNGQGNGPMAAPPAMANPAPASTATPADAAAPTSGTTPAAWQMLYKPFTGDYTTYGQNPEHSFYAEGGEVIDWRHAQKKSLGGILKKIAKTVAPIAAGAATSYFTGSDILGGLAAGAGSKLLGNGWGQSILTGLGTGALSSLTGLSDWSGATSPLTGLLGGSGGSGPGDYLSSLVGDSSSSGGGGGFLSGAGDFLKGNGGALGAAGLGLVSALAGRQKPTKIADAGQPADDAYTTQVKNGGWKVDMPQNDAKNVNWFQYGQLPEFKFFQDPTYSPDNTATLARGGRPKGYTSAPMGNTMDGPVSGPGDGQSDSVPALLSEGEYVIPADVVSHLGNGSSKAGSKQLDGMLSKVRSHRTSKHAGFPPKAKQPMSYING